VTPGHRERADRLAAMDLPGIRLRCGITASALAAGLGVHRSTVGKWETGQRKPGGPAGAAYWRVIAKLAAHLEVPE
jgi:DNA-binding transcriptional regulator YiaG